MKLKKILILTVIVICIFPLTTYAQIPEITSQAAVMIDGETRESII